MIEKLINIVHHDENIISALLNALVENKNYELYAYLSKVREDNFDNNVSSDIIQMKKHKIKFSFKRKTYSFSIYSNLDRKQINALVSDWLLVVKHPNNRNEFCSFVNNLNKGYICKTEKSTQSGNKSQVKKQPKRRLLTLREFPNDKGRYFLGLGCNDTDVLVNIKKYFITRLAKGKEVMYIDCPYELMALEHYLVLNGWELFINKVGISSETKKQLEVIDYVEVLNQILHFAEKYNIKAVNPFTFPVNNDLNKNICFNKEGNRYLMPKALR